MVDGIINVYKPKGLTSFDVVRIIKKISGVKKVGHTGTLDPLATGVLPVCLGKATKLVDYIMNGKKVYIATLRLGITTDTYDQEGRVISEASLESVSADEVKNVINHFIGDQEQIPPMYSALKVNGKRLYELAREGKEIQRNSRKITIYNIEILKLELPFVQFEVTCSKGTYIRSLCYDIGEALHCGGTMWELERTATSGYTKVNSFNMEEIKNNFESCVVPIEKSVEEFPELHFNKKVGDLLLNGVCLNNPDIIKNIKNGVTYRVYKEDLFLGLAELQEKGFKINTLLN